jgi:hypothetical protein
LLLSFTSTKIVTSNIVDVLDNLSVVVMGQHVRRELPGSKVIRVVVSREKITRYSTRIIEWLAVKQPTM